ncbi:MAG TPA: hypothetical protein VKX49_23975 [Bryobacteraceae bacterium]|nr:hypothetical protein [Bryobacteraceae bacterium]
MQPGLTRTFDGDTTLNKVARTVGATAGYLQRSNAGEIRKDAEQLMKRSPETYLAAAAAVGFVAGILLRDRR